MARAWLLFALVVGTLALMSSTASSVVSAAAADAGLAPAALAAAAINAYCATGVAHLAPGCVANAPATSIAVVDADDYQWCQRCTAPAAVLAATCIGSQRLTTVIGAARRCLALQRGWDDDVELAGQEARWLDAAAALAQVGGLLTGIDDTLAAKADHTAKLVAFRLDQHRGAFVTEMQTWAKRRRFVHAHTSPTPPLAPLPTSPDLHAAFGLWATTRPSMFAPATEWAPLFATWESWVSPLPPVEPASVVTVTPPTASPPPGRRRDAHQVLRFWFAPPHEVTVIDGELMELVAYLANVAGWLVHAAPVPSVTETEAAPVVARHLLAERYLPAAAVATAAKMLAA